MSTGGPSREPRPSRAPGPANAAFGLLVGLVVPPAYLARRDLTPAAPSPPRSEVIVVLVSMALVPVVGGVVGWFLTHDVGGVVLGGFAGFVCSTLPASIVTAVLRRVQRRRARRRQ